MEAKRQAVAVQVRIQAAVLLLLLLIAACPVMCCPPYSGGRDDCKECIVGHMSNDCPSCTPILHCMARCLWGGNSRPYCINNCNNNAYPTLSDCKRCMSPCKCTCAN